MARVVRGQVISLRTEPFIEAAKVGRCQPIADYFAAHSAEFAERRDRVSHAHDSARDAVRSVSVVSWVGCRTAGCFVGAFGERRNQSDHAHQDLLVADRVSEFGARDHAVCA